MFKCNRQFYEKTFTVRNYRSRHQKTFPEGESKPIKEKLVCKNEW